MRHEGVGGGPPHSLAEKAWLGTTVKLYSLILLTIPGRAGAEGAVLGNRHARLLPSYMYRLELRSDFVTLVSDSTLDE